MRNNVEVTTQDEKYLHSKAVVKASHKTSSHLIPGGLPVIEEGRCGDQYALEVESKEEDE